LSNNDLGTPADGLTGETLEWLSRLGQEACVGDCATVALGTATTQAECENNGCNYIAGTQLGANTGISIRLANNSLGLSINDFEQHLEFETVQYIDLSGNDLTGTLDPLGRLVNLKLLNLENNDLDGTLDGLGALWATWHSVHEVLSPEICQVADCSGFTAGQTTCIETAAVTVDADATACGNVQLGTATAAADCAAVGTAADPAVMACTFSTSCPSGCSLAGTGAGETCVPPENDCSTDYIVGDPQTPSTTCPVGCFFTAATARSNTKETTDYLDVYLANNRFTGGVEFLTQDHHNMHLAHLDLSGNLLSGEVPYNLWRSDLLRVLLTDNSFTGAIPMLRPDCEHWMGSANIQGATANPIRDDWTNIRTRLEGLNADWCSTNVAQTGQSTVCNAPVTDAAACDDACLEATLIVIPQKPFQQAGWHIWYDICSSGLSFGPGIHSGQCQECTTFEPAGCENRVTPDDANPCVCTFFAAPTPTCINQCIQTHCEQVFQNREYCQQPEACHLRVDLSGNDWSCPAPRLPPGDNSGFTMQLSKEAPWVNPVYQSAECTCDAGSTCTGDGRADDTPDEDATTDRCRAFCQPCQRGFFGAAPDADGCGQCPSGQYSDFEGQSSCSDCQPGRFGSQTYTDESATPPVERTVEIRNSEAISCAECAPGNYQSGSAQTECEPAPLGSSAPFTGMNASVLCEPGSFAEFAGADRCQYCPAGKYQNANGSDACIACPEGTATRVGGASSEVQCNDALLAGEFCPRGAYANRAKYDEDGTLECVKARPGRYVTWLGPSGGLQWEEEGAEKSCSDLGNQIAAKPGSSGCTECVDNTFANTEAGTGSLEGNTNYVCLPCGMMGTDSEYCAANWLSIGVLTGCVLLLVGAAAYKFTTRHDEAMSDSSDSDDEELNASFL
jgi:hypothetical protein